MKIENQWDKQHKEPTRGIPSLLLSTAFCDPDRLYISINHFIRSLLRLQSKQTLIS